MRATFVLLIIGVFTRTAISAQTCIGPGKFIADYNCTSYIACLDSDGNSTEYPSYTVQCPTGFYVRILDLVCSKTGGVCDPTYTCTSLGNFRNPSSNLNSSYISCIKGIGTMIIATAMNCPGSNFNSSLGQCEQTASSSVTQNASSSVKQTAPTITIEAVASTAGLTTVSETTTIVVAVEPSSTSSLATEVIPTIFTTTTPKIGTHRVNGSAHIYSSHILIVAAVISAIFYKQN